MVVDDDAAAQSRAVRGEIELVDDDVVDVSASQSLPHPGETVVPEPIEEVLGVRELTDTEPAADELDVTYDALDLPQPNGEEVEAHETNVDEALERSHLSSEPETRFEEFQDERAALEALEPRDESHSADEVLCTRCRLWKDSSQFVDEARSICCDCA